MRISIVNRKGGVAKSTTTVNLGAALAQARHLGIAARDYRVLVVDMDPQGSASHTLTGGREDVGPHLGQVLLEGAPLDRVMRPTSTPGLHVVTACEALGDEAPLAALGPPDAVRALLRDALGALETPVDFVLLDCPPGTGLPMTMALLASDRFLVPTRLERYSLAGMSRLFGFLEQVIALRDGSADPMASLLGILLTDLNYQLADAAEREAVLRAGYGDAVCDTVIRRNVTVERAQDGFRTVFQEDAALRSAGAQGYRDLAAEVLLRGARLGLVDPDALSEETRLRGRRLSLLGIAGDAEGRTRPAVRAP